MIGAKFQDLFVHGLDADETCHSARLSITFRLTAEMARRKNWKPSETQALGIFVDPLFNSPRMLSSFREALDAVGEMEADVTQMYGKVHLNAGRQSGERMIGWQRPWKLPEDFVYVYGGKKHIGKAATAPLVELTKVLEERFGQPFDWGHAVLYPDGEAKLCAHADNEPEIAKGSSIVCVTFMEDATASRTVFVRLGPKQKAEKTKAALTKAADTKKKTEVKAKVKKAEVNAEVKVNCWFGSPVKRTAEQTTKTNAKTVAKKQKTEMQAEVQTEVQAEVNAKNELK